MRVYRFENEEGYGPFSGDWLAFEFTDAMIAAGLTDEEDDYVAGGCWHNRFPSPPNDGIDPDLLNAMDRRGGDSRCAVRSVRELAMWFPKPCREVLKRYGYRVAAYEVPDDAVLTGGSQVVFDAARATKINPPGQVDTLKLAA